MLELENPGEMRVPFNQLSVWPANGYADIDIVKDAGKQSGFLVQLPV